MRYRLVGLVVLLMLLFQSAIPLRAAEVQLGTSDGLYTAPVQINRAMTLRFLVDPGATVVVIPLPVLRNLIVGGTITLNDVTGIGAAELADASRYQALEVRLSELRIGNVIVRDVKAVVAPGLNIPLLGQSFLSRFASVTFDNRRHVLTLSENETAPVAQPRATMSVAPYPYYPGTTSLSGGGYGPPTYDPGAGG